MTPDKLAILQTDSMVLQPEHVGSLTEEPKASDEPQVLQANGNQKLRIFSIDGSHTAEATYNDLSIVTGASAATAPDDADRRLACSHRTASLWWTTSLPRGQLTSQALPPTIASSLGSSWPGVSEGVMRFYYNQSSLDEAPLVPFFVGFNKVGLLLDACAGGEDLARFCLRGRRSRASISTSCEGKVPASCQ